MLNYQTVLFQTNQFSISYLFVLSLNVKQFIWPKDRTVSGATTPNQSGPGSDGNEGVLCIPESITGTSALDCLVTYPEHSLVEGSYPSAEVQLMYSIATNQVDWDRWIDNLTVLPF